MAGALATVRGTAQQAQPTQVHVATSGASWPPWAAWPWWLACGAAPRAEHDRANPHLRRIGRSALRIDLQGPSATGHGLQAPRG
ncbi:MAG: hypothetical protein U9Q74_17600 [Gemmatimonadota bacterium]|nr:hypothetical protein [Gemmatimonadota bacterium]